MKQLEATTERSGGRRLALFKKLKEALVPHARAEEKVLYDPMKDSEVKDADDLSFEACEEHGVADRLIAEIDKTSPADKRWTALLTVLKESLTHHIEEEEEDLFKKARKSFTSEEAEAMAERFSELKKDYLKELKAGGKLKQPLSKSL